MSSGYDEKTIKIIKSVFPEIVIEGQLIKINQGKKNCFNFEIESNYIY
jgi:hypothetical protein